MVAGRVVSVQAVAGRWGHVGLDVAMEDQLLKRVGVQSTCGYGRVLGLRLMLEV